MIITHGLHSRLVALHTKPRFNQDKARIIVSGKPADNAASILAEINETILSRTLCFVNDFGAELCLDIVDRRVLRVALVANLETGVEMDALIGRPLSEKEDLNDILQATLDFSKGTTEISVASTVLEMGPGENIVGMPVAHLAKQMLGEKYQSDFDERINNVAHDVLTQLDGVKAFYIVSEGVDEISVGDPDVISMLQQFVEANEKNIQSYLDKLAVSAGGKICTVLGRLADEGMAIICMRTKSESAFAVMRADAARDMPRTWKTANILD